MQKKIIIILTVFLALILGLGVWAMYYIKCSNKCSVPENKNILIGQRIFNNSKYGVSFEYPGKLLLNSFDERSGNIGDDSGFWQIIFYVDPASESLDYWLNENSSQYKKVEELTLGGQPAFKLQGVGGEGANLEFTLITIKNDNFYRILYRYLSDEEIAHIIESFRFTK